MELRSGSQCTEPLNTENWNCHRNNLANNIIGGVLQNPPWVVEVKFERGGRLVRTSP